MARGVVMVLGATLLIPVWAAQEVRVGAAHFPPYTVRPEIGVDTGLLPQLLDALNALQSDFRFVIVPTSNARRFREFKQGKMDMLLFENPAWGWQAIPQTSVDMGLRDAEVFVAKQQEGRQQSFFDDPGSKRLALFNGYHYAFAGYNTDPKFLSDAFNVSLTYSHLSNLQMVMRGRVEIALITRSHLVGLLNTNPQFRDQVMVSDRVDHTYHHYALLQPQAPIQSQQFAQLMDTLRKNGQLKAIFAPYQIEVVTPEPSAGFRKP